MCRAAFVLLLPLALWAADADLILHHGKILTADKQFSVREAVAVKNGRITAVGANDAVLKVERGAATQLIDLKGHTVVPGLTDSHVHPLQAGLSEFRQPSPELHSFADVRAYLQSEARRVPKGQWIVVPRTFPTRLAERRMPTKELLDVVTDHPVMFDASYVVIANSYALRISGITRDTPNPPRGEIVHDERGEPNGILRNAQSLLKGLDRSETFTEAEQLDALQGMLKRYVAAGLTSVIDRALTPTEIPLYSKLKAQNRLPIRVTMTWRMDTNAPTETLVDRIRKAPWRTEDGDDMLRFGIFKVTLDGGMTIGTAYQRQPYGDFGRQLYGLTDPHDQGQLFVPPDKLLAIMRAARDKGWQLTAHSQGGGAIDSLLNAFEALDREKPLAPSRSHLMHASFENPAALDRAKRLGVLADVQAAWLYLDAPALAKVFPGDGMQFFYPLRSYVDRGIILAAGSDHMIGHDKNRATNPYNPFLGMWTEVTRKTVDGNVQNPEQRLTREEALRSYTSWAAYLQRADDRKGSLEPGKLADMVVLDRDYLTCPVDQIKDITPVQVFLNGRAVYP